MNPKSTPVINTFQWFCARCRPAFVGPLRLPDASREGDTASRMVRYLGKPRPGLPFDSFLRNFAWWLVACVGIGGVPLSVVHAQLPPPGPNIDCVLVCAPGLLEATKPWIEHRARQGHQMFLIDGSESRTKIRSTIQQLAQQHDLRFVVIMGDAPSSTPLATTVETETVASQVIAKWGAEKAFASDSGYADLDGDGAPDLALGRICADSQEELAQILRKTIEYEQSQDFGLWRRRCELRGRCGGIWAPGRQADRVCGETVYYSRHSQ